MPHAGTFQSMDVEMCRGLSSATRAIGERKTPPGSCGKATVGGSTERSGRGQEVEATVTGSGAIGVVVFMIFGCKEQRKGTFGTMY